MATEMCQVCQKEYKNLGMHMKSAHKDQVNSNQPSTGNEGQNPPTPPVVPPSSSQEESSQADQLMKMMAQTMEMMKGFDQRLSKMETPGKVEFKFGKKESDIEAAKAGRSGADPKTVSIVDEILGEDFGIEIETNEDKPGFLFTLLVPRRLSDVQVSTRPKVGEDGEYIRNRNGEPELEEYWPGDRRSRAISSTQSYEAVRDHCERVRAYIVSYYQKASKPIPEFRLKQNV